MQNERTILDYLQKLGVDQVTAKVYVSLLEQYEPSVLQLSKKLGLSRTQIYAKIAALKKLGLVSSEQRSSGLYYRALPFENIDNLIAKKETEAWSLRSQFKDMSRLIQEFTNSNRPSDTSHYYGIDGLKQVNWNLTRADKEYRVFEVARIPQLFDPEFSKRCRDRLAERGITSYNLTNDLVVSASELEPLDLSITYYRHIDPHIFTIAFEVFLFDGIITLIDNTPQVSHAIEIRNPSFYTMMRQIYDTMWSLGTTINITSR